LSSPRAAERRDELAERLARQPGTLIGGMDPVDAYHKFGKF
jgi:hypothetical protein